MTPGDRHLCAHALRVAGYAAARKVHAADVQQLLIMMVRLAERLDAAAEHARRPPVQLSGMTSVERQHLATLREQIEQIEWLMAEPGPDDPAPYSLTPAAEQELAS